jgi:hypothetical protein
MIGGRHAPDPEGAHIWAHIFQPPTIFVFLMHCWVAQNANPCVRVRVVTFIVSEISLGKSIISIRAKEGIANWTKVQKSFSFRCRCKKRLVNS